MATLRLTQTTPLIQEADGTVHVPGKRVTLDTVVAAFRQGATTEQIRDSYPSLSLSESDGVLAHYLQHTTEVEEYLAQRGSEAAALHTEIDAQQDTAALRDRVRSVRRDR